MPRVRPAPRRQVRAAKPKPTVGQLGSARRRAAAALKRAEQNNPAFFTRPLSLKDATREARRNDELRYGPQAAQINSERRISDEQRRRVNDYFSQYKADLERLQRGSDDFAREQLGKVDEQANRARGQDEFQRAVVEQQAREEAAKRGASADINVSAEAERAAAARLASANSASAAMRDRASQYHDYGSERRAVASRQGVQELVNEDNRRRKLDEDMRLLKGQRGQFRAQEVGRIRGEERKWQMENAVFQQDVSKAQADQAAREKEFQRKLVDQQLKAMGLRETGRHNRAGEANTRAGHAETGRHNRAGEANTRAGQSETARHNRVTEGQGQQKIDLGAGGGGGFGDSAGAYTPEQQRAVRATYEKAFSGLRGQYQRVHANPKLYVDALTNKYGDRTVATAAVQMYMNGFVGPAVLKAMRQRGLGGKVRKATPVLVRRARESHRQQVFNTRVGGVFGR